MIYITGDVHCPVDVKKLNTKHFPEQKNMTKEDYLIVCGDMGIVWANPDSKGINEDIYWQKWFNNKNFTTVFVDGNHENHPFINSYPIVDFCGGKAHKIMDSVFHLIRGEIYTIDGKKFFCFGGAASHDKHHRKEGISWWSEEIASMEEMNHGIDNLEKHNNKIDYVITHCCSSTIQKEILDYAEKDAMTSYFKFLEEEQKIEFTHWYFGHYHIDEQIDDKHTCIYDEIIKI